MTIYENLKHLRMKNNKTQQQIADILGIHKSLYCNYENGVRTPDLGKLQILSKFYNVPLQSLILFPLHNVVVYSDGLLDELENAINEHNDATESLQDIRSHYYALKSVLNKVLGERNDALDFPDLKINLGEHIGETIKVVTLDLRGEKLIDIALKIQFSQLEKLTGNTVY